MSAQLLPLAVDWEGGLSDTLASVMAFVPNLLLFLVILFVGWIIAKAVSKFLGVALDKLGFDRLMDRTGVDDTLRNASIDPIGLICKLAYYFILLAALLFALGVFPPNPVTDIVNNILGWLPKLFIAIVIVLVTVAIANAVKDIMASALGGLSYGSMLSKVVAGFIIALGVIAALNEVGIGLSVTLPVLITVLATIGGILVVGVGGGLIGPMRNRWEGWLGQIESDTRQLKASREGGTSGAYAGTTAGTTTAPTATTGTTTTGTTTTGTTTAGEQGRTTGRY